MNKVKCAWHCNGWCAKGLYGKKCEVKGCMDKTLVVDYASVLYKAGYEQAEADFALTWEDIAKIDSLILETNNEFAVDDQKEISRQHFYEEVLKKYLQIKKNNESSKDSI